MRTHGRPRDVGVAQLPPWLIHDAGHQSLVRQADLGADLVVDTGEERNGINDDQPHLPPTPEAKYRWQPVATAAEPLFQYVSPPWQQSSPPLSPARPIEIASSSRSTSPLPDDEQRTSPPLSPAVECSTCGALYRGAVCRCHALAMSHPINKILARTKLKPSTLMSTPAVNGHEQAASHGQRQGRWQGEPVVASGVAEDELCV